MKAELRKARSPQQDDGNYRLEYNNMATIGPLHGYSQDPPEPPEDGGYELCSECGEFAVAWYEPNGMCRNCRGYAKADHDRDQAKDGG
jgi:hypothetical protein